MTLHHPELQMFNGESAETLQSLLEAIDSVEPASDAQCQRIMDMREDLLRELQAMGAGPQQGSMF